MPVLLSTAYIPPISYFAALAKEMGGFIEVCENYQKQSYRNRCRFYGADGPQTLSFPVIHDNGTHRNPVSEVRIEYRRPWVSQHKRAIESAYRSSAYYDYYHEELFQILDSKPERLIELNMAILKFFIEKTGLDIKVSLTEDYSREGLLTTAEGTIACEDLREVIHPKRENTILADLGLEKPYFQVFSGKHGFISDLSIMDLLFNEGPAAADYIRKF